MDNSEQVGHDASPIKPVSSLRSHFENMTKAKENAAPHPPPPRTVSPAPKPHNLRDNKPANEGSPVPPPLPRTRPAVSTLKLPNQDDARSRSPVRSAPPPPPPFSPKPMRPPSVMVQPPQSPPKGRLSHLNLGDHSAFLNPDSITTPTSATPSPRQFKIPSRSHSPTLDPKKVPRPTGSNPPSPPPPRRSGEFKREAKPVPPPINRAEKPVIQPRASPFGGAGQNGHAPIARAAQETSPFSSPPSSPVSSDDDIPPPMPKRPRPVSEYVPRPVGSQSGLTFEPPPVHPSLAGRRAERDSPASARSAIPSQLTGDRRPAPALPSRPHATPEQFSRPPHINNATKPPPPRPPRPGVTIPATPVDSIPTPVSSATRKIPAIPAHQLPPPPSRPTARPVATEKNLDRSMSTRASTSQLASSSTPAQRAELPSQAAAYPDASNVNRRPPFMKQGVYEISTKYDARAMAVCGQYVCTSGQFTRVWNAHDGELILSLAHGEGVKGTAVAFKPGAHVDEEGQRLWIGNNQGELMEVDVVTGAIIATKPSAHGRQEIIKIHRHFNELWTLDDSGALNVWGPGESGVPSLAGNASQIYRVPRGHTFSMVVGSELWHATGKEIRVFAPTTSGKTQFQVLIRAMMHEGAGEVTSGTLMKGHPDKVFFGHSDGKVTLYSRRDYACVDMLNVSSFKINTIAAVGEDVWAGFNTGRVCIYDTSRTPWAVRKEWHAHANPVIKLIADPSSVYRVDRMQVLSLGADNMVKVWDGMMQDDWLEGHMKAADSRYCRFEDLNVMVMTWNAGASTPHSLRYSDADASFIQNLLQDSGRPDIIVFGFQELVDLEDKTATAKRFLKPKKKDKKEGTDQERMSHQYRDWRDFLLKSLDEYMPADELYHLLQTAHMVGLFTCVFVKATIRDRIRSLKNAEVKRGMGGLHGNKGAVIIRFMVDDTSMCFINCHLAAGQSQANARHSDVAGILDAAILPSERDPTTRLDSFAGGGDGTMVLDHELCLLSGDLNYRVDTMSRDTVVMAVKAGNLSKLLERDQLLVARRRNPAFRLRAFEELPITFAPTYKYDVGTDTYDTSEKRRSPAWCDRLLYRGGPAGRIRQLDYRRHEVRVSDHRPVSGRFLFTVKKVDAVRRAEVWAESLQRFEEVKQRVYSDDKFYYLTLVCGYDEATSRALVKEKTSRRMHRSPSRHRE